MDNFYSTGFWKYLGIEMIICLISPMPFFEGIKYYEEVVAFDIIIFYELNDLLVVFMFLRIYIAIRFVLYASNFINPRTYRVCAINGCEATLKFAMIALMKSNPYLILVTSLGFSILIFGFMLKILESPLNEASG